jgi:putative hydrolase of the HAD superfamily
MTRALILDFGGVLTGDFWECLRGFARREGLPDNALIDFVTRDPDGRALLTGLERGAVSQAEFERRVAERLGVPRDGLLERMAADLLPDEDMLTAMASLRATGVPVAILSNSWGSDYFDPYAPWRLPTRADVVIISDQVGMRKPEPEIFALVVDKLGVPASECVFVDDIPAYLEPARALGMHVIRHRSAAATIAELESLFGVALS